MKRSDMLKELQSHLSTIAECTPERGGDVGDNTIDRILMGHAEILLENLEKLGMQPPFVSKEDCDAIMSVYYGEYTLNQWDEDLEKDEKVQEMKKRKAEAREKRVARRIKNEES